MKIPKNASFTASAYRAELTMYSEQIPEGSGFYIIHFERPIAADSTSALGPADHYSGSAVSLRERFREHLGGCGCNGARLTEVANEQGIRYHMHFWEMPYDVASLTETYHKKSVKNPRRFCPDCGGHRLPNPRKSTLVKLAADLVV